MTNPDVTNTKLYNSFISWIISLGLFIECISWIISLGPFIEPSHAINPGRRKSQPSLWSSHRRQGFEPISKESRWADAALNFLHTRDCQHVTFTNVDDCQRVVHLQKADIAVHLATTSPYGRYHVTLPDERMSQGHVHDAVLVLDLFPRASFGHLVLVFYINTGVSRTPCRLGGGTYLDNGECLQLASRRRCKNIMEYRHRKRTIAKRCEVNFLPVVHLDTDDLDLAKKNHLRCRNDLGLGLDGFHACPNLRPESETLRLLCDPIRENSQTCSTTHGTVRTSCKIYETCDQAILLSGGWNRQTMGVVAGDNVRDIYRLLRRNGFKRKHIKIFYANGDENFEVPGESPVHALPSTMKLAIRYHLRRLCASPHCVDSLVIYANSPTTQTGTMLLWDWNYDGLAGDGEIYTVEEFLTDIAECKAKQIQVLVDGSHAGELLQALKQSSRHDNVIAMVSGKRDEYSYGQEFSRYWSAVNDTRACTSDIHWKSHKTIVQSSPVMSNKGNIQTTLAGVPCDVRPPYTNRELKRDFFGCQNLPTAVWLRELLKGSSEKQKLSIII